jgi:hypothetical protein
MYVVGDRCNVLNSLAGTVTTGNTMAPCIIIGERAAEALRSEHGLDTSSVSRSTKVSLSELSTLVWVNRYRSPR